MNGLIIVAELSILFFLSRRLTENLFGLLYRVTKNRPVSVTIMTLLLFPGTVIHELSHLFTAEILGVRTGKLTLTPEAIRGNEIQAGSVAIVKAGPFRRLVIGIAPLFSGLVSLAALSYWLIRPNLTFYILILISYLLFSISNSIFPSTLDMEGSPGPIIVIVLLFGAIYFAGIRLNLSGRSIEVVLTVLSTLAQSLAIVLAVNVLLLLTIHFLLVLLGSFQNFKKR